MKLEVVVERAEVQSWNYDDNDTRGGGGGGAHLAPDGWYVCRGGNWGPFHGWVAARSSFSPLLNVTRRVRVG